METTDIKSKVNEILVANKLDFTIHKVPMVGLYDGNLVKSDYYGLVNSKSGNIINTVKDSYTVTQTCDVVEQVVLGMQKFGELSVKKAGSINDGRKMYLQLEIEGESKVSKDIIKRYVTILDSNDGTTGLSVGIGDLTLSCQNQFYKFYKAGIAKFRHTQTINGRIAELENLITLALGESLNHIKLYNKFQSTSISKNLTHELVRTLCGLDRLASVNEINSASYKAKNAMECLYNNIELEINDKGDNLFGLFSGVTRWTTHDKTSPRRENGRMESIICGTNYNVNQRALEFCTKTLELA